MSDNQEKPVEDAIINELFDDDDDDAGLLDTVEPDAEVPVDDVEDSKPKSLDLLKEIQSKRKKSSKNHLNQELPDDFDLIPEENLPDFPNVSVSIIFL